MSTTKLLFGFEGEISRQPFVAGLAGVVAVTLAVMSLTLAGIETIADFARPRGIDEIALLNAIWTFVALVACWSVLALVTKRLRSRGRSSAWGFVAVVPLVVLALANDRVFHAGFGVAIPGQLELAILVVATVLLMWIFVETVFLPGRGSGTATLRDRRAALSGQSAGRGGA